MQDLSVDFGKDKDGQDWKTINDGVMGGLSQGNSFFNENTVIFKGLISLENNGGFASYRKPFGKYDYSQYEKLSIRCRGNGGTFALTFETSSRFYEPNFKYEFTPKDEWQVFECNLEDLRESILLKYTGNLISSEDIANIIRFGIIKGDKREGVFELEVDYIRFE